MPEDTIAVADFRNPFEAELARIRLETDGIPAFLMDGSASGTFAGMGIASVKLYVPENDLERARSILSSPGEDEVMKRMTQDIPLPHEPGETWSYCSSCGGEVSSAFDRCPTCACSMEGSLQSPEEVLTQAPGSGRTAGNDELQEIPRDEDLAERAWRAAVFGLVTLPVFFHVYSFWLLLRLAFSPGQIGEVSWIKFLATFFINSFVIGAALFIINLVSRM